MIRFECTCGKMLKVDESLAGRLVECPFCKARTYAPADEPPPMSAPEALVAAMRQVSRPPPDDDIPVAAEVVLPPGQVAPDARPASHLEALSHAVRSQPGRSSQTRPPARSRRLAGPARATGMVVQGAAAGGRSAGLASQRRPIIIGLVAAVGLIVVFVIIAAYVGGGPAGGSARPDPLPQPAETSVVAPAQRRFSSGPQPGELFRNVPFEERKDAASKQ